MDAKLSAQPDEEAQGLGTDLAEHKHSLVDIAANSLSRHLPRVRWRALPKMGSLPLWVLVAAGLAAGIILGLLITA